MGFRKHRKRDAEGESEEAAALDDPQTAAEPPRIVSERALRTIRLLSTDKFDGRYLVQEVGDNSQGYLVPADSVQFSLGEQDVAAALLENAVRPYTWDSEISELLRSAPTRDDIRLALWRSGMVEQKQVGLREFVARLLQRGVLPLVK